MIFAPSFPRTKSLADFDDVRDDELFRYLRRVCASEGADDDLLLIFEAAIPDRERFPRIKLPRDATFREYLDKWVSDYVSADRSRPSRKVAEPKGACSDPAVLHIIRIATGITELEAVSQESHHNLFMSAENAQGQLLEEYIAMSIRPFGWLWCKGNVLRSIDFCTEDGSRFLQVKNKYNSENSSSKDVRSGTTIERWYRLGVRSYRGVPFPDYKWGILNGTISESSGQDPQMSEEDYLAFIEEAVTRNPRIVTDR